MLKYLLPILYLQKVFPMDLSLEKQKRNLRSKFNSLLEDSRLTMYFIKFRLQCSHHFMGKNICMRDLQSLPVLGMVFGDLLRTPPSPSVPLKHRNFSKTSMSLKNWKFCSGGVPRGSSIFYLWKEGILADILTISWGRGTTGKLLPGHQSYKFSIFS
jgi:hypothetical protein